MPYSLKFIMILVCLVSLFLLFVSIFPKSKKLQRKGLKNNDQVDHLTHHVAPSKLLSKYEVQMYALLTEACPKHIVLCQVSFNAFLKCGEIGVRNKFNRSMCDFMIVDSDFIPIVCVELDDRTHLGSNKLRDQFRDDLLSAAYIPTERFFGLPTDINMVRSRLKSHLSNKNSLVYQKLITD